MSRGGVNAAAAANVSLPWALFLNCLNALTDVRNTDMDCVSLAS